MTLRTIDKRSNITREVFKNDYLTPQLPIVFTDLASQWFATEKWTFDYFKQEYGKMEIPVYDNDFHKPGKGYMKPTSKMPFAAYLSLIQKEPTQLRMFLFNIFQHAPELLKDVKIPTIMDGFVKEYPFMFFGGEGSFTPMHYDIDCSSVFLTQFQSRKRVVLFAPDQSPYLYQYPFTVQSPVNVLKPNYDKFPAFKKAVGYETILGHGETLFIPSTYWHFIEYIEGGYSLSLRANDSWRTQLKGLWNLSNHFVIDKGMNALCGIKWKMWKEDYAQRKALDLLATMTPSV
jgi:Cupin-like domain